MTPRRRGSLEGVFQIVKYNWSFYVAGLVAIVIGLAVLRWVILPGWISILLWIGVALAAWWWLASLVVSWWIYDLSGLMNWNWLAKIVDDKPGAWLNLHAGLDESTPSLTEIWGAPLAVLDIFDAQRMTEPSIRRARDLTRNATVPTAASHEALPIGDAATPLATVLFTAHELREPAAREALFRELNRVLAPGGRLVVVEHVRDCANFVAFGPGFMHFMPDREWLRLAAHAGLHVQRRIRKTPFVVLYVLEKH